VDEPLYFVDFLREPVLDDETGEVVDAHPSFYEAVPGGLAEVRQRVEALQRRFNEESKARGGFGFRGCAEVGMMVQKRVFGLLACCQISHPMIIT